MEEVKLSSELFYECNLVGQLDHWDFNSNISHIHLAKIQPEVFSVIFHNQATSFWIPWKQEVIAASCPSKDRNIAGSVCEPGCCYRDLHVVAVAAILSELESILTNKDQHWVHVNTLIAIKILTRVLVIPPPPSICSSLSRASACNFIVFLSSTVRHVKVNKCCHQIVMQRGQKTRPDNVKVKKKESLFPWKGQELLEKNKTTQVATYNKMLYCTTLWRFYYQ